MSRLSSGWTPIAESLARMEAEDRIHNHISRLPREIGVITSVKLAMTLAAVWETEAQALLQRGDRGYAYYSTQEQRFWLKSAHATCSANPLWTFCSVDTLRKMIANISSDTAALVSYRVARSICNGEVFQ